MRWVWRAESGAGKIEYGALVVLAAVIIAGLLASGLPTDVTPAVSSATCELFGGKDCEPKDEAGAGADDPSAAPSPGAPAPEEDDDGEGRDQDLIDAETEYNEAQWELHQSESDFGNIEEELLDLLADLIGLTDAKKCLLEGDIGGCLSTAIGLIGPLKLIKIGTKIPKMWRLYDRFKGMRAARNAAKGRASRANGKLDDAIAACGGVAAGPGTVTAVPAAAPALAPSGSGAAVAVPASGGGGGAAIEAVRSKKGGDACKYTPPPKDLSGFPGAKPAKPKTSVQGGGGKRKRWKDEKGNIYEWDSQHGTVEKYNKRGKHQGEYDTDGNQTKPANKDRSVEP
ncbi:putative cytotoxic protein [Murinocardiopsis flavida]|uniref:Putative cytotoxic protein n=1 Tax=Murinocardiopsis flavida TaxID=645275 RepID=A0A2P8DTX3_9ACTN|nr:colicin E3/pyocin S6 family cytotoxin [Murinocardiopsis flavida]PSL00642.1 putative cytotoxic protein [Murinocardiopsis flavida]